MYNIKVYMSKHALIHWLTRFEKTSSQKGMVGFLIRRGAAKTKRMANTELVVIAIFFFAVSLSMISCF
jgi:hypothetical protein